MNTEVELDQQTTQRSKLRAIVPIEGQAFLLISQGEGAGRQIELKDTPLIVGRSSECDLRLLNRSVSRLHCRVWRDNNGYWLRDLNSTNKTFLNERPMVEARLKDGDLISVGGTVLKFAVSGGPVEQTEAQLYDLATTDPLTGLANRRHFDQELDKEISRSARHGHSFAVAILDVDGMGRINEQHGQTAGDELLRSLGRMVYGGLRQEDTAARLGGEEFGLLLVEINQQNAASIVQAIRSAIGNASFMIDGKTVRATVSGGVVVWSAAVPGRKELMAGAQAQLLRAKTGGRNRVCWPDSPD
jgi:diguanylate cyclase (GGDEF)-like protein